MRKRNWKKTRPTDIRHAMELCLHYAREKKNLSVDRVADLMGLPSKWSLYKWLENGRLPMVLIRPFEHACGIDFLTQYLAYSDHKLLVDIPTGRAANEMQVNELQGSFAETIGLLIRFYQDEAGPEETLTSLNQVISGLAWHRANIGKSEAPELALFEGDEDEH